jgi:hypothetical protein
MKPMKKKIIVLCKGYLRTSHRTIVVCCEKTKTAVC